MKTYKCAHKDCPTLYIVAIDKFTAVTDYAERMGFDPDFAPDLRSITIELVENNHIPKGDL